MLKKIDPSVARAERLAKAKLAIDKAATDGPAFEVVMDFDLANELREWVEAQGIACGVHHDTVPVFAQSGGELLEPATGAVTKTIPGTPSNILGFGGTPDTVVVDIPGAPAKHAPIVTKLVRYDRQTKLIISPMKSPAVDAPFEFKEGFAANPDFVLPPSAEG